MTGALRLGFHYHLPAYRDAQGRLHTPGYQGRFLDSLAIRCEQLVCLLHSPRADEQPEMDYVLQADNIYWVDMGLHRSVPHRMLYTARYLAPLQGWPSRLDVLLIRGPSPLLPAVARTFQDIPLALLIVGDYLTGIQDIPQPRWRREAIRLWAYWNQRQQLAVARRALTFVNNHHIYQKLSRTVSNIHETRTTTLQESDFFQRANTCTQTPVRLLFSGRVTLAKGILDIVEAVATLIESGEDVVLDIVGGTGKSDAILGEIDRLAARLGITERIVFHGFKTIGPELFAHYQNADIFITASRHTEGFPRTIWEAMAHSLPVVATGVGSIPAFLTDAQTALIVAPQNPGALAAAIARLLHDPSLRARLIAQGLALAHQNTLEYRAQEMIALLSDWVDRQRRATRPPMKSTE